jgi:hypothetical protein
MSRQQQPPPVAEIHWRKVHKRKNANMLFAEDLGPPGTKAHVEIVDSGVAEVASIDGKKEMPWISFRGKQKKLGLGITNCKTMESICGTPIVQRWRGWITLVVVRITYYDQQTKRNEQTDAIRIAPQRPRASDQKQQPAEQAAPPSSPPATDAPAADGPPDDDDHDDFDPTDVQPEDLHG